MYKGYFKGLNNSHMHDFGRYLLAFSIFWTYLSADSIIGYSKFNSSNVSSELSHPINGFIPLSLVINFKNHFLISMPHMADAFFAKSIIYICEHDSSGAMGIIINKTLTNDKRELILNETGLDSLYPNPEIYFGGPVQMNRGLFLHSCDYANKNSKIVSIDIKDMEVIKILEKNII